MGQRGRLQRPEERERLHPEQSSGIVMDRRDLAHERMLELLCRTMESLFPVGDNCVDSNIGRNIQRTNIANLTRVDAETTGEISRINEAQLLQLSKILTKQTTRRLNLAQRY